MYQEHDTVTVLFQDQTSSLQLKPTISETHVIHGPQGFKETLPCQVLTGFYKSAHQPALPDSYQVDGNVFKSKEAVIGRVKDTAWSLLRLDSENSVSIYPQVQNIPSWSASNSVWTKECIPVKTLAFLPVLQYPVTDYSTVYTGMKTFVSINSKLVQNEIPMYCDEKVYSIVKEIQLRQPEEFSSLVPMLGTFHMIKTALICIGKALDGSGAEFIWLEAGVFGPTVI